MTHAADIAKATGQNIDDEEILTIALGVGRELITDDLRKPGVYDAEQPAPPDTSAADRAPGVRGPEGLTSHRPVGSASSARRGA